MSRRRSSSLSVIVLSFFLTSLPLAVAACYQFTTIDVPGASSTTIMGINDAGQVVGAFFNASIFLGFVRDSNGSFTTIDVPAPRGLRRSESIMPPRS